MICITDDTKNTDCVCINEANVNYATLEVMKDNAMFPYRITVHFNNGDKTTLMFEKLTAEPDDNSATNVMKKLCGTKLEQIDHIVLPERSFGTVEIGGRTYKTVRIGNQEWLAENLCLETEKSYQNPEHPEFGRYYEWDALHEIQSQLPTGWRVPSDEDFNQLFKNIGRRAGQNLKSTTGWYDDGDGTDDYGFSVLPAGSRNSYGCFSNASYRAYFWSSSESSSDFAYYWYFRYYYDFVYHNDNYKDYGFSVRCVRDLA